jgi:hypothetical protein
MKFQAPALSGAFVEWLHCECPFRVKSGHDASKSRWPPRTLLRSQNETRQIASSGRITTCGINATINASRREGFATMRGTLLRLITVRLQWGSGTCRHTAGGLAPLCCGAFCSRRQRVELVMSFAIQAFRADYMPCVLLASQCYLPASVAGSHSAALATTVETKLSTIVFIDAAFRS